VKFVVVDVNAGTALADRVAYASAQQRQLREHFAPLWDGAGEDDEVRAATPAAPALAGEVQIQLEAQPPATVQGALGYHDRAADGTPIIYVFVALAAQYGDVWTSVASHEVLEVRGDPRLRASVQLDDGAFWDKEVCDRVQADTYLIDGVKLSNFNTPACFEPNPSVTREQYDYLSLSSAPNQVRPGGYAQKFDSSKGWTMVSAMRGYRAYLAALGMGRPARRTARHAHPGLLARIWRKLTGR
jgi:hypothetical protein